MGTIKHKMEGRKQGMKDRINEGKKYFKNLKGATKKFEGPKKH